MLHLIARFAPGATTLRPFLHKLRGVKISGKIFIGDDVYLENEYPEAIEMFDGSAIAPRVTILAHFRGPGKIIIKQNAIIGTGCIITVAPNKVLTIGECSFVSVGSVVTRDVPPYTLVQGYPARPVAKITVPMTLDGPSYEEFKKGLKYLKKN